MEVVYDKYFNQNEWYTIIALALGIFLVFILKKRFSFKESLIYFLYSFFIGMLADHTIGVPPFDFYDVNDNSTYEFFDFLTYFMYGFYGFLIIYIYDYFKIKSVYSPIYILSCSLFSIGMELIASYLGVFHYRNGYKVWYSFPIYLLTQSFQIFLYKSLNSKDKAMS